MLSDIGVLNTLEEVYIMRVASVNSFARVELSGDGSKWLPLA